MSPTPFFHSTLEKGLVIMITDIFLHTVELDFKTCQDKNHLGFKNQITNDQLGQISFKSLQDKNNLSLRTKLVVTKNVLKLKFDYTWCKAQ